MDDNHRLAGAEPADQDGELPDEEPAPAQHTINESHDKIRLEIGLTRGTGTRDKEKHKLKVRGETPDEAAANLSDALEALEDRNVFDRAREVGNDE